MKQLAGREWRFAVRPATSPVFSDRLHAEMGRMIALSACPQDMLPVSGRDTRPIKAHSNLTRIEDGHAP